MDFREYLNDLNNLDNQELRVKIETIYTLNSSIFEFFGAINDAVHRLLKQPTIDESAIKQLEDILPTLIKLRKTIFGLDHEEFANGYRNRIYRYADYIRKTMALNEAEGAVQELGKLLDENKKALIDEKREKHADAKKTEKDKKRWNNSTPLQKAEELILSQGVSACDGRTLWMLAEKSKNAKVLELIARENPKQAINESLAEAYESNTILSAIASNPHTPIEVLYFLAFEFTTGDKYDDEDIRIGLANNPNIPEDIIKVLAVDKSKSVRFSIARNPKTPQDIKVNLKQKEGCFVATVCYGDYDAPEVLILRKFRDEKLLKNRCGIIFVRFYYAVSPLFAKRIENHATIKTFIRNHFLRPIVRNIQNRA